MKIAAIVLALGNGFFAALNFLAAVGAMTAQPPSHFSVGLMHTLIAILFLGVAARHQ